MLRGVLLFIVGMLAGANLVYFVMSRQAPAPASDPAAPIAGVSREPIPDQPMVAPDAPTVTLTPSAAPRPTHDDVAGSDRQAATAGVGELGLIVPVRGVTRKDLSNTYEDARGEGRVHEAIDIMAARGTPVLAVTDGEVEKLFSSDLGGLTIYQFEPSGRYAYYYAHLDRYAGSLAEGRKVKQGEVIGYVGSTGNASDDAPHLHFGIVELGPERKWWKGTAINPYPVLRGESSR